MDRSNGEAVTIMTSSSAMDVCAKAIDGNRAKLASKLVDSRDIGNSCSKQGKPTRQATAEEGGLSFEQKRGCAGRRRANGKALRRHRLKRCRLRLKTIHWDEYWDVNGRRGDNMFCHNQRDITGDAFMCVISIAIGCGVGQRAGLRGQKDHGNQNPEGFYERQTRHRCDPITFKFESSMKRITLKEDWDQPDFARLF
jgi:hypothetical protein